MAAPQLSSTEHLIRQCQAKGEIQQDEANKLVAYWATTKNVTDMKARSKGLHTFLFNPDNFNVERSNAIWKSMSAQQRVVMKNQYAQNAPQGQVAAAQPKSNPGGPPAPAAGTNSDEPLAKKSKVDEMMASQQAQQQQQQKDDFNLLGPEEEGQRVLTIENEYGDKTVLSQELLTHDTEKDEVTNTRKLMYAQLARTGVPSVRTIAPPAPTGTPGQPNGPNPVQATVTTAGSGLQTVVNVSLPPHPTYGTPSPLKSNERKLTKAEKVKSKAADWSRHNIVDKDTLRVIHAHTEKTVGIAPTVEANYLLSMAIQSHMREQLYHAICKNNNRYSRQAANDFAQQYALKEKKKYDSSSQQHGNDNTMSIDNNDDMKSPESVYDMVFGHDVYDTLLKEETNAVQGSAFVASEGVKTLRAEYEHYENKKRALQQSNEESQENTKGTKRKLNHQQLMDAGLETPWWQEFEDRRRFGRLGFEDLAKLYFAEQVLPPEAFNKRNRPLVKGNSHIIANMLFHRDRDSNAPSAIQIENMKREEAQRTLIEKALEDPNVTVNDKESLLLKKWCSNAKRDSPLITPANIGLKERFLLEGDMVDVLLDSIKSLNDKNVAMTHVPRRLGVAARKVKLGVGDRYRTGN